MSERGIDAGRHAATRWRIRRVGSALLLGLLLVAAPSGLAHGQDDADRDTDHPGQAEDRVSLFSTILVTRDRPAADVACIFCTVRVEGPVRGDVAVMFGTVSIGEAQTVDGDTALLFSTLNVDAGARLNGDLATAFSTVQIAPGAHVRGDRAMLASGLGLAVLLGPILILVGLVWLLVWVLRRALL